MSLDKLEKKVNEKVMVVEDKDIDIESVNYLKLNAQLDAIYRLINNVTRRIERSLLHIEQKQNVIIKAMESSGVDLEELQRQEEIKKLEQQLKELKGRGVDCV